MLIHVTLFVTVKIVVDKKWIGNYSSFLEPARIRLLDGKKLPRFLVKKDRKKNRANFFFVFHIVG